jgi:hypothetical protein
MEIVSNNIFQDDQLISLIKSNFNKSDMELFELNYKIYTIYKNNQDDFIVDLDEVYKWIGFNQKSHAKRLLESKNTDNKNIFQIDKDYIVKKVLSSKGQNLGGRPLNKVLLTITCFKKYCLKASTEQSEKIYDYYIKMEEIITKYIENKHNEIIENNKKILEETKHQLELKDIETNQILELKNQEIENNKKLLDDTVNQLQIKDEEIKNIKNQTYEEIDKNNHIYIFTTDKPNIYKCGKTNDMKKRKAALQTGTVDNIITLEDYLTSDEDLLEKIVFNILHIYRCKSGREHFFCNWKYIQLIIHIAGCFLDTLKSTYEYITKDELLEIIKEKISKINFESNNESTNNTIQQSQLEINESNDNIIHQPQLEINDSTDNTIQQSRLEINNNNSNNKLHPPVIVKCLKHIIDSNKHLDIIKIPGPEFLIICNNFITNNNLKITYSSIKIWIDIKNYDGIERKKIMQGNIFIINIKILKSYLLNTYKIKFIN